MWWAALSEKQTQHDQDGHPGFHQPRPSPPFLDGEEPGRKTTTEIRRFQELCSSWTKNLRHHPGDCTPWPSKDVYGGPSLTKLWTGIHSNWWGYKWNIQRVEHKLADLSLKDASLVMIHPIVTVKNAQGVCLFSFICLQSGSKPPFFKAWFCGVKSAPNKFPSTICHGFGIENLNF